MCGAIACLMLGCSDDATDSAAGPDAGGMHCSEEGMHIFVTVEPDPIAEGQSGEWDVEGAIVSTKLNGFQLDTCPPGESCTEHLFDVKVSATGLWSHIPVGAYVRVHLIDMVSYTGTDTTFAVQNLPSWQGSQNPASDSTDWYLLTAEQYLTHPDAPFDVKPVALDCSESGGVLYDLVFSDSSGNTATLDYDGVATLELGGQMWDIKVLRAFQSPGYDAPVPFTWLAAIPEP